MPTPNYGYEKRQKELAKKRKKEEKLKAKAERKSGTGNEGQVAAEEQAAPAQMAGDSPVPHMGE